MKLSEFQQILGNSIRLNRDIQNVWVQAELSDLRVSGGHCYVELVEKDESGVMRAKLRAMIWSSTLPSLRRKFYTATGRDLDNGLKVQVRGSANHHNLYGLSFVISDIDPSYTLGDMERLRREILERLTREGIINQNKMISPPSAPQRIAVISAEGAAGYGDFMNQLKNNPDGFAVYTGLFPAIMQGERTVPTMLEALRKVAFTRDQWDAVVIIRGGGATTDLNSFDNYELARAVALFPLPVIVGIGHERDRTVLDEIACIRCKTPTAVAEYIIGSLRETYALMADLVRRIAKYGTDALKGEHLKLANISQAIPALAKNRVLRSRMALTDVATRLRGASNSRITNARIGLDRYGGRLQNNLKTIPEKENKRLEHISKMLSVLSPENTLRRGYSITRVDGKAVTDASSLKTGDTITTTLASGSITSKIE